MKKIIFLLIITLCTVNITKIFAQVNKQDSLALVNLYDSTGGVTWTNTWNLASPVNTWYGITTSNGRVTVIQIEQNNLNGPIPSSLGSLSQLTDLVLGYQGLTGPIPSSFGNLSNLSFIEMDRNQIIGNIPSTFSNLSKLNGIEMEYNQLSGNIPSFLGNLTALTEIDFLGNSLTGEIPSSFQNLINMYYLDLSSNHLTGNIPSYLSNFTGIFSIYLHDNQFTGTIPPSLGNLINLVYLDLSANQLTGSIPSSFSKLAAIVGLRVENNQLSGTYTSLNNLPNLNTLYVQNNQYTYQAIETFTKIISDYMASPQADLPLHYNNGNFSISAGGKLNENTYWWFRDNELVKSNIGDSVFSSTKKGNYYAEVSNANIPGLSFNSDTISIPLIAPKITTIPNVVTSLCPGTSVSLISSSSTGNTWNTGATTQSIMTDTAGSYSVTVNGETSAVSKVTYQICGKPTGTADSAITSTSAIVKWNAVPCHTGYTLQYRKTGTNPYITFELPYLSHKITGLLPLTTYEWRVRTVCIDSPMMAGGYTTLSNFTTTAGLSDAFSNGTENGISIYPNPAHTSVTVNFRAEDSYTSLQVVNATGQSIMQKQVATFTSKNTTQIDVSMLARGIYMLLIKTKNGIQTKQFVKE